MILKSTAFAGVRKEKVKLTEDSFRYITLSSHIMSTSVNVTRDIYSQVTTMIMTTRDSTELLSKCLLLDVDTEDPYFV